MQQPCHGPFSAVSTLPIARVGAFFSIFHDLQDIHAFAPLQTQNFRKILPFFFEILQKILKILQNFGQILLDFHEISPEFHVNFELLKGRGRVEVFRTFFSFFQADALHCAAF